MGHPADSLDREPFGVGHYVDHGDGAAELEFGDQTQEEGCGGFSVLNETVFAGGLLVPARLLAFSRLLALARLLVDKMAVGGDAAQVDAAQVLVVAERLADGRAEAGGPRALKGEKAAEDVDGGLGGVDAAGVGDGQAGAVEPADCCDLLLRVLQVLGGDGLLGPKTA